MRPVRLIAVVVSIGLVGACGGGSGKRLPEGGPCDLVTESEVGKVFGPDERASISYSDATQCQYRIGDAGVNVIRGQDMAKMRSGETEEVAGLPGRRLMDSGGGECSIEMVLDEGDAGQRFAVFVYGAGEPSRACEVMRGLVGTAVGKV